MTRRPGRSASNDPGFAGLLDARADAICFVAKAWDYHVRVALGIVGELVVCKMLEPVMVRGAPDRKHGQPVGGQLVEQPVAKEHVMAGFVAYVRQPVLPGADQDYGADSQGQIPRPREIGPGTVMIKGNRQADDQGKENVLTRDVKPIGDVVQFPQRIDAAKQFGLV